MLRNGWSIKRQTGSHKTLSRDGWPGLVFAFHDNDEIGPRMLARLAKHAGCGLRTFDRPVDGPAERVC